MRRWASVGPSGAGSGRVGGPPARGYGAEDAGGGRSLGTRAGRNGIDRCGPLGRSVTGFDHFKASSSFLTSLIIRLAPSLTTSWKLPTTPVHSL